MSKGGWSCPKYIDNRCTILKKECDPGDKGCVLYGKALLSNEESPSKEAFEKRMERKMREMLRDKNAK